MNFRLAGKISDAETIVTGNGIREIARLRRVYGPGRWRKHKEIAKVAFDNGLTRTAEVHWFFWIRS